MDDDVLLWLVGALAFVVVVAAFVWVLRHRGDAAPVESPHSYPAPEVTITGGAVPGAVAFGTTDGDEAVDQTVPLSRLGGAGWRDGDGGPSAGRDETTSTPYAGESPAANSSRTWGEDPQTWSDPEAAETSAEGGHHVSVEDTGERPVVDEELDRERGGHW